MNWYFGPPHIKGITPPDFNKTNILPTENWERAGGHDWSNCPDSAYPAVAHLAL